jgi:hypothetical protein
MWRAGEGREMRMDLLVEGSCRGQETESRLKDIGVWR